jgi:anti-sigma factor (TIGR02949 family)
MDCTEVLKFIQVYLDGEFDEKDRLEMDEHLKGCLLCGKQVDVERRFRDAIRARIPKPAAPLQLRDRLVEAMDRTPRRARFPRILVWSSVPAAAALVLVVMFTWTVSTGFTPLVESAVDRHSSALPVEVNSASNDEVEGWFRAKVNFNVALPRFAPKELSLVGARLSNLAERQAALVRYHRGAHDYSLFVFADPGGSLEIQRCQKVAAERFCLVEKRGYTVAVWRSHGLAYSLVGDLPPSQMIETLEAAFAH